MREPALAAIAGPAQLMEGYRRLPPTKQSRALALGLMFMLLGLVACAKGSSQLNGWSALQPGMELWSEPGRGPHGEPVMALLYALVPGNEYGIERQMPIPGLQGRPSLQLMAKATRVLYLAVVLLDSEGNEHKSAALLQPGDWRALEFDAFQPAVADWSEIMAVRFMDYTAVLIGQGSVSLKLVGLPQ
jgi:hypothetical protein